MKKLLLMLTLFLTLTTFGQVTILNNGNMNGFNLNYTLAIPNTTVIRTNGPNYVDLQSAVGSATATLDTALNLVGYDYIEVKVKYTRASLTDGPSTLNGNLTPVSINGATLTYTTTNITSLTFTCTMNTAHLFLIDLKITGYPSVPTSIKNNQINSCLLFADGNTIKSNISNDYKLRILDLTGRIVLEKPLQNENKTDLKTGIYILNVIDVQGNLIENKRILITE